MSRRDYPNVGPDLLAAVSASLAVLKTHLASDDPKVSLRATSELTKLLAVCARNGIELAGVPEQASGGRKLPVADEPDPQVRPEETGGLRPPLAGGDVPSAGGGDDYAAQLNQPPTPTVAPSEPVRKTPSLTLPARNVPGGKPRLTSFLGRADPVSQPQRPARPLALPD